MNRRSAIKAAIAGVASAIGWKVAKKAPEVFAPIDKEQPWAMNPRWYGVNTHRDAVPRDVFSIKEIPKIGEVRNGERVVAIEACHRHYGWWEVNIEWESV